MKEKQLRDLRKAYQLYALERDHLLDDPKELLNKWLSEAIDFQDEEPTAMSLSTVDEEGTPSSRIVLLKAIDDGLVFFSNYHSKKGQDIAVNNKVALLFHWKVMERQVRVKGTVEKISEAESIDYFQSRPKGSQLGAWASAQSKVIPSRKTLDDRMEELRDVYRGRDTLPKPAFWGGYRVLPTYFEFWQGRDNRLHDRFSFTFVNNNWDINRLSP